MSAKKKKIPRKPRMLPVKKKRIPREPMSKRQYLISLEALGLTVAGKQTAAALGLGLRQCQRLATGETPVPLPVELLLNLYLKYPNEVPPKDWLDE